MCSEQKFDGVVRGYIAPKNLNVSNKLKFYRENEVDIDPITYEVIRYSLFNINMEHGDILQKLCISPITILTQDFQPSILTEDAEIVFIGPYLQYFSNCASLTVKWVLENRSDEPGIEDGDMFLNNDPYVGTTHQPDVVLICPVFWEGKLFGWVSNVVHHSDVGGITPGSFCPSARDIWDDPPCIPPIKIVKAGKIVKEVEHLFTRQSRMPANISMDLRASIAGNNVAKSRILKLIERYGPDVVKGVMRRINDAGETAFLEKLKMIPDGKWSGRIYNEVCVGGDKKTYRLQVNITKNGQELIFDNEGTDPQAGAINLTYSGWMGTALAALNAMLCYDQAGATGGALRRITFKPVEGTLLSCDFPGAVSPSGVFSVEASIAVANEAISKMLACSKQELKEKIMTVGNGQWPIAIFSGISQNGYFYVAPDLDNMIGCIGASPVRDGIDCGGQYWIPQGQAGNVEEHEYLWPILYLYRTIERGGTSGAGKTGAGKRRGGRGAIEATIPWGTKELSLDVYHNETTPKSPGLLGGYPGGLSRCRVKRNTDVWEQFESGKIPATIDEIAGSEYRVVFKEGSILLNNRDVWEWGWPTSAGYGDPLDREPERVAKDIDIADIDQATARDVYGVAFNSSNEIDLGQTEILRQGIRKKRLERAGLGKVINNNLKAVNASDDGSAILIGENLQFYRNSGSGEYRCAKCNSTISTGSENYKNNCVVEEMPIEGFGPEFVETKKYLDDKVLFRMFYCPECATLLDTEIAREGDPCLWDIMVK